MLLRNALSLALYEVSLPRVRKEQGKSFKDLVASMEQFYAGMSSFKPHFVLELASPATENETDFYVAVPRDQSSVFERQVHAVFPTAEIREESSDYNIFKYRGFSVGAIMKLKENNMLPIRTYDKLEVDPLEVIANSFSGFDRKKEGAALQVVINPDDRAFKKRIAGAIGRLEKGESLKDVLAGEAGAFGRQLFKIIFREKEGTTLSPGHEEVIDLLKNKISRQVMRVNIRLVASSETKERASRILDEMKTLFSQFMEPQGNSFVVKEIGGRGLKSLFYDFSFRLFSEADSFYLNTAELTTIFHFPAFEMTAPRVKFLKIKRTEPPSNLPSDGTLIGKNIFRGQETKVCLETNDRRRHFYLIGQTGTGKTVLMKNMILQDLEAGHGLCFIDPHGDSVEEILAQIPQNRFEDVIYFNPGDVGRPLGLNMLEFDPRFPEQKTLIVNELLEIFNKLYNMSIAGGPMFEQYFRNAALLVMDDPESGNTLFEISRVLSDKEFRHYKLSRSKNPIVKNFWLETAEKAGGEAALQNMVPYITSKFDTFLANEIMRPILCQQKSAFNFRDIMDTGKIFLVNLSKGRLGEINAYLLGLILVGRIFLAAMSRADTPEEQRKDFYLYIDEFQNVTTKSISMILSEARKYRLSLTIAHQFIGQLEEEIKKAVFGNVGSLAIFRVGNEDAEFLARHFAPVFLPEDMISIPNYNAYLRLLIKGETSRPFNIETYPPAKGDENVKDSVKKLSSIKYGKSLSEVESEINQRYLKTVKIETN